MQQSIQAPIQSAHFFDQHKGILYMEDGGVFNVAQLQSSHDVHDTIERIKRRFKQVGRMGCDDIVTCAL